MRNVKLIGLGILFMLFSTSVYSQRFGVSDHLSWQKEYEDKAREQGAIAVEHEKMKKDARLTYAPGLHQGDRFLQKKYDEIEGHCDAIIQDAQRLQNDYLEFARWHRMQASESEGQLAQ